jgi:hypothetical protein
VACSFRNADNFEWSFATVYGPNVVIPNGSICIFFYRNRTRLGGGFSLLFL